MERRSPAPRVNPPRRAFIRALSCLAAVWCQIAAPAFAISSKDESELGRRFDFEARSKLPLLNEPDVARYLDRVGATLVGALADRAFEYRFTPLRDGQVNAFAVPGGFVYVNAGVLVRAGNDDEVAGVLGHEIAHVQAHHLARQQEKTQLLNYAVIAGLILSAIQPAIGAGALAASSAVQLKYQRGFEQEADFLGARYMRNAGYEPRGMLDFFKKLMDDQRGGPKLVPPYLLSHPLTEERLTNLEAVLRQSQWDRASRRAGSLDLERARLAARVNLEPIDAVIADYRRRVEENPADPLAAYLFGTAQLLAGNAAPAREMLRRAQQLGVQVSERELGRLALQQRAFGEAIERLRKAAEIDPQDALVFRELGRALEAIDDRAGAMEAYGKAVELSPSLDDVHYSLGMLAGRSGRTGEGYYHLGEALLLRGEYQSALNNLHKASGNFPEGTARRAQIDANLRDLTQILGLRPR